MILAPQEIGGFGPPRIIKTGLGVHMDSSNKFKGKIGQVVEYKAVAWLMLQGFEVFKNVAYHGPVDILTLDPRDGAINLIDVKKVVDASRSRIRISNPSTNDRQKALEVKLLFYDEKSDFFAWTIEDIYTRLGKIKKESHVPLPQVILGKDFASQSEACRYHEVHPGTVRAWRLAHPEGTLEQAISHAVEKSKMVRVNGVRYANKRTACERLGLNLGSVEYWHYEHKMSFEDAVNLLLQKKGVEDNG
jgi:Holliday junction resolvase-like predicted endonuclease